MKLTDDILKYLSDRLKDAPSGRYVVTCEYKYPVKPQFNTKGRITGLEQSPVKTLHIEITDLDCPTLSKNNL